MTLALIAFGCKKGAENIYENDNAFAAEISKVVTVYEEGMEKFEGDNGLPKIETIAPEEFIEKIRKEQEKNYSKQVSYAKNSGNLVGVFKGTTCGGYSEMIIHFDLENTKPATSLTGNVGESYINAGNAFLYVCMVDNAYFNRTNNDYAIINFSNQSSPGVGFITRYFDTEDSGNANSIRINGIYQTRPYYLGNNMISTDIILEFYFYSSAPTYPVVTPSAYPSLGFSYHVLGTFGTTTGNIYFDDEDSNNINYINFTRYGYTNVYGNSSTTVTVPGVIQAFNNTRLYFSKVN